jgi:hypothetical protein
MTNAKSDFVLIRSMIHNYIRKCEMTGTVRAHVSELPGEQTKIEVWIPQELVSVEWLGVADYMFGHFGGDNDSGKFKHVSMGGEENGSYSWYIVGSKTEEKEPDESPMLLQYDMPF